MENKSDKKNRFNFKDDGTSRGIGVFWKVLWRWKGSVYKLLYRDLILYMILYYIILAVYKFALDEDGIDYFEDIIIYCRGYSSFFPISFVLGFFVSTIMTRWWSQYTCIPRPLGAALFLSSNLSGNDDCGKALRRTIIRYANCSITMLLRNLSVRVQKRFPHPQFLVKAGLLNDNEYTILDNLVNEFPGIALWNVPLVWAATITTKAREINRITNDDALKTIIDELNSIRAKSATLNHYNTVNISSVYSQVVTIACYSYFLAALFGSQIIESESRYKEIDFGYFPVFLILQFVFYMGWLKVAEQLMNPFGEDDDDFDVISIIDNNLQMSYLIVDKMHDEYPMILKDCYWGDAPQKLQDFNDSIDVSETTNGNTKADLQSVHVANAAYRVRSYSSMSPKVKKTKMPDYHSSQVSLLIDPELLPKNEADKDK